MKKKIIENIKTIFYALIIALIIRSFLFQPFYIPSSSMEPNLLVGDRLFVSKYSYGYSQHSFPFSLKLFSGRIFTKSPERGDIIVFKTPEDNRTDFIKRLIGLPGDTIQFRDGIIYLNEKIIERNITTNPSQINCSNMNMEVNTYQETLPKGKNYQAVYNKMGSMKNTDKFIVPEKHFFFMGDNRDCSKDSRYLNSVGYVNFNNLVGKANLIFFSNDKNIARWYEFWKWHKSIRFDRFFKKIS